jgi:hypothetical protein
MRLYELWNDGEIKEIIADSHIDEFEFYQIAKRAYNVEIEPGSIKQMWQTTILNKRKRHETQVCYSYPITVGRVKPKGE